LQLFVSIQAIILNEYPWLNEPGRENEDENHPAALAYNNWIYGLTARWAILEWAEGKHAAVWEDVVDYHFPSSWRRDFEHSQRLGRDDIPYRHEA
jgi:hypothetical protein